MTLLGKHGDHPVAPDFLHRRQDAKLVVDQHVALRRIEALDVVELLLLVDVDEDLAVERLPQAGPLDLARLENGVAVRQHHRPAPLPNVPDGVQRPGVKPVGERIVDQPARHQQETRIVQVLDPITLERAEIVGIAELAAQLLEDLPSTGRAPLSP